MWEALDKASYYRLSNLIAIVDVNRLGQRGATELGWNLAAYAGRAEAFGAFNGRSAYLCDPEGNYFEIAWADEPDNPVVAATRRAAGA